MPWKAWLLRPLVGGPNDTNGVKPEGVNACTDGPDEAVSRRGKVNSEFSSSSSSSWLGLRALGSSLAPDNSEFSLISSASSASSIGPLLGSFSSNVRLSGLGRWLGLSSFSGEATGDG